MSEFPVTHSMDLPPGQAAAARIARPNGWWGMAVFVATEVTLFTMIFGAYFYTRFKSVSWPPPGIPSPSVATPLILTGVLVSTSIPLQLSFWRACAGRLASARWLIGLAVFVQLGYFAMQIHMMDDDLTKFSPSKSAYGSVYYLLLGAHHAHVVVGILLEVFLLARLLRGLTNYRLTGLQSTVFFWHFVNVLALCVVAVELTAA